MTAKQIYIALVAKHGVEKKLPKREIYDTLIAELGITAKQLGGYVSVLSRKGAILTDKTTIKLLEIEWDTDKQ